jgi:hypothetical protein
MSPRRQLAHMLRTLEVFSALLEHARDHHGDPGQVIRRREKNRFRIAPLQGADDPRAHTQAAIEWAA